MTRRRCWWCRNELLLALLPRHVTQEGTFHLSPDFYRLGSQWSMCGLYRSHLTLQNRLHISRLHRKPPNHVPRRVMHGRCDRRRCECVRCFRSSSIRADFRIVEQYDFDLRYVSHRWDGIRIPVLRGDTALVEHDLFEESVADSHDRAAFNIAL